MTEDVRSRAVDPDFLGDRPVDALAPVAPVARPPEATGLVREERDRRSGEPARPTPDGEILAEGREQRDGPRLPPVLERLDPPVAQSTLDQQRAFAHVAPFQCERLLWPQPGVREDDEQRRVAQPVLLEQPRAHQLDDRRRDRLHRGPVRLRRLARELDRVRRNASPLDRALQDALEHRHRLADRLDADAVGLELGAEARDDLRGQLAELQVAEARQRVPVPEIGVDAQRRALEVGARVDPPPLLDELGERLAARVHVRQRAGALEHPDLRLERASVAGAVERLAALGAGLVAPAHPPDDVAAAVSPLTVALLDHLSALLQLPECGGRVRREHERSDPVREPGLDELAQSDGDTVARGERVRSRGHRADRPHRRRGAPDGVRAGAPARRARCASWPHRPEVLEVVRGEARADDVPLALGQPGHLERDDGRLDGVARQLEPIDQIVETVALGGRGDDEFEQHDPLRAELEAVMSGRPGRHASVTVILHRSIASCAGPGDVPASPGALSTWLCKPIAPRRPQLAPLTDGGPCPR